jgi:hypothetical protein
MCIPHAQVQGTDSIPAIQGPVYIKYGSKGQVIDHYSPLLIYYPVHVMCVVAMSVHTLRLQSARLLLASEVVQLEVHRHVVHRECIYLLQLASKAVITQRSSSHLGIIHGIKRC